MLGPAGVPQKNFTQNARLPPMSTKEASMVPARNEMLKVLIFGNMFF